MSLSSGASLAGLVPLFTSSAVALLAYLAAAAKHETRWVATALGIAWAAHGMAIGVHAIGVGEAEPGMRFGFAPTLSVTLWLVLAVYAIETRFMPLMGVVRSLALMGAVVVSLAAAFPGELRPLAGSPWAPVHWMLGIASYGLFGVALLHAALLQRAESRMRGRGGQSTASAPGMPLLGLEKLTFRFLAAGFVVLSVTLILGWWFSNPWRWDHKTVFSMLAWAVFAALLVGRQVFGWRGRQALRWLYFGTGLLLLAYVGSRFVIEVLLERTTTA